MDAINKLIKRHNLNTVFLVITMVRLPYHFLHNFSAKIEVATVLFGHFKQVLIEWIEKTASILLFEFPILNNRVYRHFNVSTIFKNKACNNFFHFIFSVSIHLVGRSK